MPMPVSLSSETDASSWDSRPGLLCLVQTGADLFRNEQGQAMLAIAEYLRIMEFE
jgi:hypothetical protein